MRREPEQESGRRKAAEREQGKGKEEGGAKGTGGTQKEDQEQE